ncbi:MAG: acetyl esterase/lipase [Psychromonas sp.]|jgi:acetyl esterase/lipase|uniref:hypothetical protein n=1 Tax=Psychromonas sp. TaxID=1884585 RepID=UPI0039E4EA9E
MLNQLEPGIRELVSGFIEDGCPCPSEQSIEERRDEGEALYKKLLASGVEAYCERYLGVIHGFFQLSGVIKSAIRCLENVANQIAN